MSDGFVVSRGVLGTFVVDRRSRLHRYVVVCGKDPSSADYPLFWTAIEQDVMRLTALAVSNQPRSRQPACA